MTSSVAEAFQRAQEEVSHKTASPESVAAPTRQVAQAVSEWSQDDSVHVDPPMQTPQPPPKEDRRGENGVTAPRHGHLFAPSNNVTRESFQYIKDNPGKTRKEVMQVMAERGYNPGSVSSLLGQFTMQRLCEVRNINGVDGYHAIVEEFRPLKSGRARDALLLKQGIAPRGKRAYNSRKKELAAMGIPQVLPSQTLPSQAFVPETGPGTVQEIVRESATVSSNFPDIRTMSADQIINHLGLRQARELFLKLKDIFG